MIPFVVLCTSSIEIKSLFLGFLRCSLFWDWLLPLTLSCRWVWQSCYTKYDTKHFNRKSTNSIHKKNCCEKKQFAREHGRNYKSGAEVQLRREIFNENYKSMMEHNARSAGQLHPILFLLLVKLHFPAICFLFLQ